MSSEIVKVYAANTLENAVQSLDAVYNTLKTSQKILIQIGGDPDLVQEVARWLKPIQEMQMKIGEISKNDDVVNYLMDEKNHYEYDEDYSASS